MSLDGSSGCGSCEVETVSAHVGTGHEADRQLRRIAASRAALDVDEARWLIVGRREEIHVPLGCVTFVEYMERVLGYGPRKAYERLRVAHALERLPAVCAAMEAGDTSYSAVRELTRIATGDTEQAWLVAARGRTAREVQAMVRGRRPGDRPEDPAEHVPEPRLLRFEVQPETYALFRDAQRQAAQEAGHAVSDDEMIAWLCRSALRGNQPEGEAQAVPYQIALTVCAVCEGAKQDGAGEPVDVAADARSALRNLGYPAAEAARAIASAHVGEVGTLQDLVRAALRELRPAR